MTSTERLIASVREDRRADYLWDTKRAARAVGEVSNTKFSDWWYRTRRKLTALCREMPAETAAEMLAVCAEAASHREASVVGGQLSVVTTDQGQRTTDRRLQNV